MSISFDNSTDESCFYDVDSMGGVGTPIGFQDIIDYFTNNPISSPLIRPLGGAGTISPILGDMCEGNSTHFGKDGDTGDIQDESIVVHDNDKSIKTTKTGSGTFEIEWNKFRSVGKAPL